MSRTPAATDRRLLLILVGAMVLVIVGIAFLSPKSRDADPRPTTDNTDSQGAKAAYLLLKSLGRPAVQWKEDSAAIGTLDAPHTTLVLAGAPVRTGEEKALAAALEDFLRRGGRVLVTGVMNASLLPGGSASGPGSFEPKTCYTNPEGTGALAAVGQVPMGEGGSWHARGPQFRVEQRCLGEPVVVSLPVGAGEAVWWSSASPMTNLGLKNDGDLKLFLATIGESRAVYFDEFYFEDREDGPSPVKGLPLWWLGLQAALLCVLVVLSFSRRKGPLRLPVVLPRSSPVEFAQSMGGLYGKARATEAATEAARRRLERALVTEAGLSRDTIREGSRAVTDALAARLGGDWTQLDLHMEQARVAATERLSPGDALQLVRALAADEERIRTMVGSVAKQPVIEGELAGSAR